MHTTTQPQAPRTLTAAHRDTIRATLPVIAANINEITQRFYRTMFTNHPELEKDLFNRGNQKDGNQQKALAASIAVFATHLVDEETPNPAGMLARIGHKHASLGITADQYQIVHDNLFAAIVDVLGEAITPDVAEAWDAVYWIMADTLIAYEADLYTSANTTPGDVFRTATITGKRTLPGGALEITLEGDLAAPQPGQYTSLGVRLPDGARQLRQYSITKGNDHTWTIALAVVGEVSTYLRDHTNPGDTVEVTLPAGDMTLRDGTNPIVFITSRIGATPILGMLNHLAATGSERTITHWHLDDNDNTHALAEQLTQVVSTLPNATTHTLYRDHGQRLTLTGDCGCGTTDCATQLTGADVYLCGGTNFLTNIREQLDALPEEHQPAHVAYELFSPNDWLIN